MSASPLPERRVMLALAITAIVLSAIVSVPPFSSSAFAHVLTSSGEPVRPDNDGPRSFNLSVNRVGDPNDRLGLGLGDDIAVYEFEGRLVIDPRNPVDLCTVSMMRVGDSVILSGKVAGQFVVQRIVTVGPDASFANIPIGTAFLFHEGGMGHLVYLEPHLVP